MTGDSEQSTMASSSISASAFRGYVRDLRNLNAHAVSMRGLPLTTVDLARQHLDGRAGRELRAAVDIGELRRLGAFFTGNALSVRVVELAVNPGGWDVVYDPACGCGDLLLAAAERLPVLGDLNDTLRSWGTVLQGNDLVPEFVEVTRQRLMLLALLRGSRPASAVEPLDQLLPGIRVGDGRCPDAISSGSLVLVNPPYGQIRAPRACSFGSGLVSEAALWIDSLIDRMPDRAQMVAVLPDVLRSGSRYAHLRRSVSERGDVYEVQSQGRFDALTDVDVFLLRFQRSSHPSRPWPPPLLQSGAMLGDRCRVQVGTVVDHRDPHKGPAAPYITAQSLPLSGEVEPTCERSFAGRLFDPPFVVLRRTSRPTSTRSRLHPVIVVGHRAVAVENHLIVVVPLRASLSSCRVVSRALRRPDATDWLNARIRCRHLTVAAIRELPIDCSVDRF
jgi:hypothetical protein